MNLAADPGLPRWHRVVGGLFWELVWKNKVAFPALGLFLAAGIGLVLALEHALPNVWWASYARGITFVSFIASVVLAFAPFTLMDNHGSWRMNSVTSRWSILPVRTLFLVALPLLSAWLGLGILVSAWAPVLSRIAQGIDMVYIWTVFCAGAVAAQALAWTVPRKPSQFWVSAAVLFLAMLLGAVIPQESRSWPEIRVRTMLTLSIISLALGGVALWAAYRNRCGDWPGEIPFTQLLDTLRHPSEGRTVLRSTWAGCFWSEVAPTSRAFLVSWGVLAVLLSLWVTVGFWMNRPDLPMPWSMIGVALVADGLPNFGVVWLMGWALFLACEPGMGFQTRLSGFRATCPVTVGTLAGTRLATLIAVWLCVWVPLLVVQHWCIPDDPGMPTGMGQPLAHQAADLLASRMVFSAGAVVAALPVLLWGRLEGFPTVFLATIVAWAWSWMLSAFVHLDPAPDWLPLALTGWVGLKVATAAGLLWHAWVRGYTTWRFPLAVLGGWVATIGLILCWSGTEGPITLREVFSLAAMMPLVRLTASPLAMAANRHG